MKDSYWLPIAEHIDYEMCRFNFQVVDNTPAELFTRTDLSQCQKEGCYARRSKLITYKQLDHVHHLTVALSVTQCQQFGTVFLTNLLMMIIFNC